MFKFQFAAFCLFVSATLASAQVYYPQVYHPQVYQPVQTYSQPTVVYSQPVYSAPVMMPASTGQLSTSVSCCSSPPSADCPDCKYTDGIRITHTGNCTGGTTYKPYEVRCEATLAKRTETVKFYKDIIKKPLMSEVPEEYTVVYETVEFKECVVNLPCCKLEFCIPCRLVCTEKTECRMVKQNINVELRVRTSNSHIDVVAVKVPGMPTEYLLGRDLSKDEVKKRFGIDVDAKDPKPE